MTLEEGLIPVYEPGRPFQQDNARIYIARMRQEWFEALHPQIPRPRAVVAPRGPQLVRPTTISTDTDSP